MNDSHRAATPRPPTTAEAVGTLLALLDSGGIDRRRYRIVNRLCTLRDSDDFTALPQDLRDRVREIVADTEPRNRGVR